MIINDYDIFKLTISSKKISKEISFLVNYDKISNRTIINGKIVGENFYIQNIIDSNQQTWFTKEILTKTLLLVIKQLENHHLQNKEV